MKKTGELPKPLQVEVPLACILPDMIQAMIEDLVKKRESELETPIEVKKVRHPEEQYNWGTRPAYTETVIESIDNVNR